MFILPVSPLGPNKKAKLFVSRTKGFVDSDYFLELRFLEPYYLNQVIELFRFD